MYEILFLPFGVGGSANFDFLFCTFNHLLIKNFGTPRSWIPELSINLISESWFWFAVSLSSWLIELSI